VSGGTVPSTYERSGDWQNPGHFVQVRGKNLPRLMQKGKETLRKYTLGMRAAFKGL
jgi:hypothetical protein